MSTVMNTHDQVPHDQGAVFRRVLGALRRRAHVVGISGLVGVCVAFALTTILFPRYTAKAQVIFEPSKWANGAQPSTAGPIDDATVESQIAAITSEAHLRRVLERLVSQARAGNDGTGLSAEIVEAGYLDNLARRLKAFKELHSRVIGITYTSKNPELAAAVTNQAVEIYLAGVTERMRADRDTVLKSLNDRIPVVMRDLERAEGRVQDYRIAHGVPETNRGNTVDQLLADLNGELAVAKADLAGRQARLVREVQHPKEGIAGPTEALSGSGRASVLASTDPQAPHRYFTEGVADPSSKLATDSAALQTRVRLMEDRLAVLRDATAEGRKPELQLRQLQQEATAARQLYDGLVQRRNEVLEREVLPDVRVLSPASIPIEPSSPNPILLLLPSLVFACGVGGMLAVFMEQLDQGLRSEQDVKESLGVSCIGLIPKLPRRQRPLSHKHLKPSSSYAEAIKSVVASALRLSEDQWLPEVFLVTSSISGEGKTTLATSFAGYAAQLNRKVLLVDFSFKPPGNTGKVPALDEDADSGVSTVLNGQPVADLIRTIPDLNFDYLPLCRVAVDVVALIATGEVKTFLREIKADYDCVVIDGAPILSRTEVRLLASMVDKVIVAVKWGGRRQFAQNASGLLRAALGHEAFKSSVTAVLTQVDVKQHARYRRGDIGEVLYRLPRTA